MVCKHVLTLVAIIAYSNAVPLSYIRDTDQSVLPYQNQAFVYLRDNGANQIQNVFPLQSSPTNFINNVNGAGVSSQIQTIYPNGISNGFVSYPNNGLGGNFVNNVNNGINGYSTISSLPLVQNVPAVNYAPFAPSFVQPTVVGGLPGYQQNEQIYNSQTAPVEVNFNGFN